MKGIIFWKRIFLFLTFCILANPIMVWAKTYPFQKSSTDKTIDPRIILEMGSPYAVEDEYGVYMLMIGEVILKIQKGFECSEFYGSPVAGYSMIHNLKNFTFVKEDENWLFYRANDPTNAFRNLFIIDSRTGIITEKDAIFYPCDMKVNPKIKDVNALFNILDYHKPGSATLEGNTITIKDNTSTNIPLLIIESGAVITIKGLNENIKYEVNGGNLTLEQCNSPKLVANSASIVLQKGCNISDLTQNGGSVTIGEEIDFDQITLKKGSLVFQETRNRGKLVANGGSIQYPKNNSSDSFVSSLEIDGDVIIEGNGYLADNTFIKNGRVIYAHKVTDTPYGAQKAYPFTRKTLSVENGTISFNNVRLSELEKFTISGTSAVELINSYYGPHNVQYQPILLKGGTLIIDKTSMFADQVITVEDGDLTIRYSSVGGDPGSNTILLNGDNAHVTIESGSIERIETKKGNLAIKGGRLESLFMNGGSLSYTGGLSKGIDVLADCSISLSGGACGNICFAEEVSLPTSASLLAAGCVFYKDFANMRYPLGKELKTYRTSIWYDDNTRYEAAYGYDCSGVMPASTALKKTAAYAAAETADVGPDGKDVKVRGTNYEIYTPAGLAWIAIAEDNGCKLFDGTCLLKGNGQEYIDRWSMNVYKLMNDLDMTGYGENWPAISLSGDTLDGQGHHIYNLNMAGATEGFSIISVTTKTIHGVQTEHLGVLCNLTVEGSLINSDIAMAGGLASFNDGLIVNCAFIGTVHIESVTGGSIGGLVGYNRGRIENCYVSPCRELIKGVCPISTLNDTYLPKIISYDIAQLVGNNHGIVENCYSAGEVDFDNHVKDNSIVNVNVTIHNLVGKRDDYSNDDYSNVINCYNGSEVSLPTLNKNVQNHQQDPNYPWATWSVDPDKQCGMPYLVFNGATPPYDGGIIITGDEPYEPKTHIKANVIVKSGAIYTINEPDASIASLTIEDGGQVRLRKPLNVTDSVMVRRYIETDKWTTLCIPEIMMMENNFWDMSLEPEQRPIWSKIGYMDEETQRWMDYGADNIITDRAHLYVARFASQMGFFHTIEMRAPFTLKAAGTLEAPANVPNGDWFHFVANPYWENLPIEGRAYVLNEAGTSFELRENPVIPPFHCYMVASEEVMSKVSSLRLSGLPTSVDKVKETGLRAWTEQGTLCFETVEAKAVSIYSISGMPQARYDHSVGVKRISLPKGVYLIVCEGQAIKVIL